MDRFIDYLKVDIRFKLYCDCATYNIICTRLYMYNYMQGLEIRGKKNILG